MKKSSYLFSVVLYISLIVSISFTGAMAQAALVEANQDQKEVGPIKATEDFFDRAVANGNLRPVTREDIQA